MPAEADGPALEVRRTGSGILLAVLIPLLISGTIDENGVELERYRFGNIIMLWGMLVVLASLVTVPVGLALAAIASWIRVLMRRGA